MALYKHNPSERGAHMQSQVIDKFPFGVGKTGPVPGDTLQAENADKLANELLGPRFYVTADGELVARCIDERLRRLLQIIAGKTMAPNAAGGTMTLTIADILTGGKIVGTTGTLFERHERMVAFLVTKGLIVGGHADEHDHSEDGGSGCGACDQLSLILALLLENLDDLCGLVTSLTGIEIDDDVRNAIRGELQQLPEIAHGNEILEVLRALPEGRALIEEMIGAHDALAAVINFVAGTTLDREALMEALKLSAFNMDVWAFKPSAELLYGKDDQRQVMAAVIVMYLYNFATSAKLCNKEIRVVVRR